ncbi:MAG: long-chain fatty acid--CoA ligase [Desulfobacteraceae bacterium]|nr:long-chain fatty acid--CoA ligase [Desulfobacteraceae bacterium]
MLYDQKPWIKFYDKMVTQEIEKPELNYLEFLNRGLKHDPGKIAFHYLGSSYTFKEMDELSTKFALFLIQNGYKKGDVVGINLPNTPQFLIALAGSIRAGCIVTGTSPLLTPKELIHQINDSGTKIMITLDILYETNFASLQGKVPDLESVIVTNIAEFISPVKRFIGKLLKKIPVGKTNPLEGMKLFDFRKILSINLEKLPELEVNIDDTLLYQYTGGTTGPSKGTILTHRSVMSNIKQIVQWFVKSEKPLEDSIKTALGKDICCSGFPMYHVAGMSQGLQYLGLAGTQVLVPDPRNTDQICKDLKKYKPQVLLNVSTLYLLLMDNPKFKKIDFSGLIFALSGAAPLDVHSNLRLEKIIGKGKVIEAFGMTEAGPIATMNPFVGKKKTGSIGIPVQSTKIKIVDMDTGKIEMGVGEPGELIIQGPQMMDGYFNKNEATKKAMRDSGDGKWLYTGDIAKMDEDGFIYIVDRTKDMLLVGGYNVYSKEVEDTLYEIPSIELCAIVGKPNPQRLGSEIVKAVIQLSNAFKDNSKDTLEEEITKYCRQNLAPYKIPKIFEFQEKIPLTPVGKVDKKLLRK